MIQPLPIVRYPDPRLQRPSVGVLGKRQEIEILIERMIATMRQANGVGLAAPQIGLNERLCVVDLVTGPTAFLNPRIISFSQTTSETEEGCLSLPGIFGILERPVWIEVSFETLSGEQERQRFEGLAARILQHELDHLDGILIIDRWKKTTQGETEARKLGIPIRQ